MAIALRRGNYQEQILEITLSHMAFCMSKKPTNKKIKKRRYDAILIGTAMCIAFAVIIMRYIDYWPCDILGTLKFESIVSCSRSPQENMATIYSSIQQGAVWIANLTR
jgi:hypothetical protein